MLANTDLPIPAEIDWDYLRWNCYCSERHRIAYVATPKVACTSIKWWFAKLGGYAQAIRQVPDSAETEPDLVIHDSFHKVAPEATGFSQEALRVILESDSYFKFAVVRNPYRRIFSAWQSKLVLREPIQAGPYVGQDFFHRPLESMDDIAPSFEAFLDHLAANEAPSFWDFHWVPQVQLLRPDLIGYSCIAKIEHPEALAGRLFAHLGSAVPNPFKGHAANESLIPYRKEFVTARAGELIRSLYADDFSQFQYADEPPPGRGEYAIEQCDVALKAVKMLRGRHQRFAALCSHTSERLNTLGQSLAVADGELLKYQSQAAEYDRLLVDANSRVVTLEGENQRLRQALVTAQDQAKVLEDETLRLGKIEVVSENLAAENQRRTGELNSRIIGLEEKNCVLVTSLAAAESQLDVLSERLGKLKDDDRCFSEELEEYRARITVLEGERCRFISALQKAGDGNTSDDPEAALQSFVQHRASEIISLRFLLRQMTRVIAGRLFGRKS